MAKTTLARIPRQIAMGSILNWDVTNSRDPKELAYAASQASDLAHFVTAGYTSKHDGSHSERVDELVRECTALSSLLCFVLARELGALDKDDDAKDGA